LNRARRIPKGTAFSCPADTGETALLLFGYRDGTTLRVTVSTSGCLFANNGNLTIWMPTATLTQLEVVLGHDHL